METARGGESAEPVGVLFRQRRQPQPVPPVSTGAAVHGGSAANAGAATRAAARAVAGDWRKEGGTGGVAWAAETKERGAV